MKVIIVGKGTGWWNAPMDGEVWGLNDLLLHRPVSLSFEMHDIDEGRDPESLDYRSGLQKEIDEINRSKTPVMVLRKHKDLPTGIVFPIDEMPRRYFTSSMAYMIAYATYKKVTAVDLYGIPVFFKEEFYYQRPCIEYWLGRAETSGAKITIHKPSNILSSIPYYGLYGYEWMPSNSEAIGKLTRLK